MIRPLLPDVRMVMATTVAYMVAGAIVVGLYACLLFLLNLIFFGDILSYSWPTVIGPVAVALLLAKPVLERTQKVADSWLRRKGYDSLRTLTNFTRYARDITDLKLLALTIEQGLMIATGAEEVRLLAPSSSGLRFTSVSGRSGIQVNPLDLEASSPVATWLRFHEEILTREEVETRPVFAVLSEKERADLDSSRTRLLVPVRYKEELAGILVLGPKRSGMSYSGRDLASLRKTAAETAMWVSNATLFTSVSSQRNRLEQLLGRTVSAREDERKRLALELHDSPVQWLTSAAYRVEACLGFLGKGQHQKARKDLEEVQEALNETLEELRHTASALHPPELEKVGLIRSLTRYTDAFERATGVLVQFREHGTVPRLSQAVELAAYRVVQEALSNVRKHAEATEVKLDVGLHNGTLWATIRDNGNGFQARDVTPNGTSHLGLAGMEERAHMLGGTLGVQSAPPQPGTRITLLIPYNDTFDVTEQYLERVGKTVTGTSRRAEVIE